MYDLDYKNRNDLTIKICGNQWYWRYEYSRFHEMLIDCFMMPFSELKSGWFRLQEVDNCVVLPCTRTCLTILSSNDVIHRWSLPSMNLKTDANPGRLNSFYRKRGMPGVFYGMCSEICGDPPSTLGCRLALNTSTGHLILSKYGSCLWFAFLFSLYDLFIMLMQTAVFFVLCKLYFDHN